MSDSSSPSPAEPPARFDCTALVPTMGRPGLLRACLESLRAQDPPLREVIVLDQSGNGAICALAEERGALRIPLRPGGLARARNAGLAAARGEWLFFPDDDCAVTPGFTAAVVRFLAERPDADFLCGRVETPDGRPLSAGMGAAPRPLDTPRAVLHSALSAGLLVRRRVIERVGGFDERFGVGARFPSGEESDLLLRALAAGCRGWYVPDAVVLHPEPFGVRDDLAQAGRAYEYGRGWGALFAKHGTRPLRPGVLGLYLRYLARAAGGAALALPPGRRALARRYLASLRGRLAGFREFRREPGEAP